MNLTNAENLQLKQLLEFILHEIWIDDLDLKDFNSVIGRDKEEVQDNLKNNFMETIPIINLLGSIDGYPFTEEYEKKCEKIKDSCEFFLEKILEIYNTGIAVINFD